jgi:hypothetical protein
MRLAECEAADSLSSVSAFRRKKTCPFSVHRNATTVVATFAPLIVSSLSKRVSPHNGQAKKGAIVPSLFYLLRRRPSPRWVAGCDGEMRTRLRDSSIVRYQTQCNTSAVRLFFHSFSTFQFCAFANGASSRMNLGLIYSLNLVVRATRHSRASPSVLLPRQQAPPCAALSATPQRELSRIAPAAHSRRRMDSLGPHPTVNRWNQRFGHGYLRYTRYGHGATCAHHADRHAGHRLDTSRAARCAGGCSEMIMWPHASIPLECCLSWVSVLTF